MNIIILAAGVGKRLKNQNIIHKSFLKINKYTIIENLIINFKKFKIKIVVGFNRAKIKKELSKYKDITFINNQYFKSTEMLYSLTLGIKNSKEDDILITYSDIIYDYNKIQNFFNQKKINHISIPVLINWKKIWKKRLKNYLDDLESLKFDTNNNLLEIGKKIKNTNSLMGQYMGIIYIPKSMNNLILESYDHKFWNKKHVTEFLNYLISKKIKIKCIPYYGFWYEFDQNSELESFKNNFSSQLKFY